MPPCPVVFPLSPNRRRWRAVTKACRTGSDWDTSPRWDTEHLLQSSGQMDTPSKTLSSEHFRYSSFVLSSHKVTVNNARLFLAVEILLLDSHHSSCRKGKRKKISHLKMNIGFLTTLASALHVIATCHLFFTGNKKGLIPSERTLSGKGSCWPNASRPQWPRLRPQAWSKTNAKAKPMEQRAKRMTLDYNISSFLIQFLP